MPRVRSTQGGSTITQQVIKNLNIISHPNQDPTDRGFNTKIQEAIGALGLTSQYQKSQILTMYFNIAPFDNADEGIEAAVEKYFQLVPTNVDFSQHTFKFTLGITRLSIDPATGKDNPLLGLARASMLAAIPNNPTEFDPTLGDAEEQLMLKRQAYVLNAMMKNNIDAPGLGPVTPAIIEQAEALTAKMQFKPTPQITVGQHFVDWVKGQLALSLGNGDYTSGSLVLERSGLNIRTTLDYNLEKYVEASITRHLTKPERQWFLNQTATLNTAFNVNDSAAVVLNAHTGEILAMAGSADYFSTDPLAGGKVTLPLVVRERRKAPVLSRWCMPVHSNWAGILVWFCPMMPPMCPLAVLLLAHRLQIQV